ncbi:uncharacterized protein DS421_8g238700 [Arachis hypogaea]|nr:uncharacterized protein DS421_8g238700 [Arachis hypogaea]
MPKEEEDSPSSPSRRSPPPRRSTPHPSGRSAHLSILNGLFFMTPENHQTLIL